MIRENIIYWDGAKPVDLPERTKVQDISFLPRLPSVESPEDGVKGALTSPQDMQSIEELVDSRSKVTIAFDDPCIPVGYSPGFREVWLKTVLDDLSEADVSKKNIRLVCATGLHRKFTKRELAVTIGNDLIQEFGPRLFCHDAEDEDNLVHLGETESGYDVEVNSFVKESDLLIYTNFMSNIFNGGWKSVSVGLSTYKTIRHHHGPEQLNFSGNLLERSSEFHDILKEMGEKIEEELGRQIFKLETVINEKSEVAGVFAGSMDSTREDALNAQMGEVLTEFRGIEPADVLIYGLPRWMPYSTFAKTNPILNVIGMGLFYLAMPIEFLLKKDGVLIMLSPCPDVWDEVHHPSYLEAWDRVLETTKDPQKIRDQFEEDFAHRPDYIYKYRFGYAYHPVHPLFLLYSTPYPSKVIVAGANDPSVVRHMGFTPARTPQEAIEKAEDIVGKDCSISYMDYKFPGVNQIEDRPWTRTEV